MKKIPLLILCAVSLIFCGVVAVNATTISTSAYGNMNGSDYGYTFSITDEFGGATTFAATLLNESDDALIDLLAFNMDATLSSDFAIKNINPNWTFSAASAPIQFDYVGDSDTPGDRLNPSSTLTFVFDIDDTFFGTLTDPFELWTETSQSAGIGIGGGDDSGQVAVSFQGIGGGTFSNDSDLLASNWNRTNVPEPATMLLLGSGLLGLVGFGRKKILKK